ncbi:MAG: cytochrome c [Tistlia sp.]|uniref:cytochrome c n=1 Tax=Tistlia sp. TaxID=3057121 RepID=UPI0034A250D6
MADRGGPARGRFRLLIAAGVLVLVALAVPFAVGPWRGEPPAAGLRPDAAAFVAEGAALYAEHCASCHGADLGGQANWRERNAEGRLPAPPHDASGHTWHHSGEQLFALTKYGPAALVGQGYESDMPAYEGILDDREIWAVLSYIKSRWPTEIRARHDGIDEAAR